MWQLTQEQQALVTDNLGLAGHAVKKVKTWLEWDDVYAVSCAALCNAAHYFDETRNIKFSTYALHCCVNAIIKETNYQNRVSGHKYRRPINIGRNDPVSAPESSMFDAIYFEDSERVTKAIGRMHGTQKTIIEMWLSGVQQTDIGKAIGLSRSAVSISLIRSTRYLKELLNN